MHKMTTTWLRYRLPSLLKAVRFFYFLPQTIPRDRIAHVKCSNKFCVLKCQHTVDFAAAGDT